jgi:nucleoside-diphosphate-sugar epimerase
MENKISVYGATGFIGNYFCNLFAKDTIKIDRSERAPQSKEILYFISTTDNYNVYDKPQHDIYTNLTVLMETLSQCKDQDITFNFISS